MGRPLGSRNNPAKAKDSSTARKPKLASTKLVTPAEAKDASTKRKPKLDMHRVGPARGLANLYVMSIAVGEKRFASSIAFAVFVSSLTSTTL
eukprot:598503-Amphidinium_carterae.1